MRYGERIAEEINLLVVALLLKQEGIVTNRVSMIFKILEVQTKAKLVSLFCPVISFIKQSTVKHLISTATKLNRMFQFLPDVSCQFSGHNLCLCTCSSIYESLWYKHIFSKTEQKVYIYLTFTSREKP